MATQNNLGRVQGGGMYGSTSTSTTSIAKTTVQANGKISPLVGDTIINANGDLCQITAISSDAYTVKKYSSIKSSGGGSTSGGSASEGGSDEFGRGTFNDMSWEEVIKVIKFGKVREVFRAGDRKLDTLANGTEIIYTIIDTSGTHDVMAGEYDVTDENIYGHCEGFAPLTLAMFVAAQDLKKSFGGGDPSGNTKWSDSNLRAYLNDTVFNNLSDELKPYVVPVIKQTALPSGGDADKAVIEKTADKLFLFSAVEIMGDKGDRIRGNSPSDTDTAEFTYSPYIYEGEQYEYFKSVKDGETPNGRILWNLEGDYQEDYWLRTSPDEYTATYVDTSGIIQKEADLNNDNNAKYCAFGFCICDLEHTSLVSPLSLMRVNALKLKRRLAEANLKKALEA